MRTKRKNLIDLFIALFLILASINISYAEKIKVGVSENTPVEIVAEWPIGADTEKGEHFSARTVEDIVSSSGEVFIPKNSRVVGTVVDISGSGSFHRNGKVDIKFEKIIFPDNITKIKIEADGRLVQESGSLKILGGAIGDTLSGAAKGAIIGWRFGGIMSTTSSTASNLAIGAATGAGIALISFIAKKGRDVEITPGLPMTLNINQLQKQDYKAQKMPEVNEENNKVKAKILKRRDNKVKISIKNNLKKPIALTNLKIIDGLGYTVKPNISYNYFSSKSIPATSEQVYNFSFNPITKSGRYWLVLTDSFGKQEYFRKEISQ